MSGQLVTSGESSRSQVVEKLSKPIHALASKPDLIRAVLPKLPASLSLQLLGQERKSRNIIRLTLNDGSSHVSPGDEVQGTLKMMISELVTVKRLTVQLWGRTKSTSVRIAPTHGGGHIRYESFFKLVDEIKELELEQKTLKPKIYEIPFQITLPRTFTIGAEKWPYDEKTQRFNSNLTQPLPGSFQSYSNETAHAHCSIKYYAIAKLVSEPGKILLQHKIPLNVLINDTRALTVGEMFNAVFMKSSFNFKLSKTAQASIISTPSGVNQQTGSPSSSRLKNIIRDNVSLFGAQSYLFDLGAQIPRFGRLSEPLDIVLKLSWRQHLSKPEKSKDSPIPPVSLKAMQVELQSRCMFRGTTKDKINDMSWQLVEDTLSYHVIWKSQKIVISELKAPVPALNPETEVAVASLMFVHPHSILPAFKTANISRDYVLTVVCDLECAGKSFQARYSVDRFDVLSGDGVDDDFFETRPAKQTQVEKDEEVGDGEDGLSDGYSLEGSYEY